LSLANIRSRFATAESFNPLNLLNEIVVFGDDVIPVFHAVVKFLHKVIPLGDEVRNGLILFFNAGIGILQFGLQLVHRLLVLRDGVGEIQIGELQAGDRRFLRNNEFFVRGGRGLDLSNAGVQLFDLVIQGGDGIRVALNVGISLKNHSVQGLDFIALQRLFIPLKRAEATQGEREGEEQVLLEVFHVRVGRERL
jgi:hypothetical protein